VARGLLAHPSSRSGRRRRRKWDAKYNNRHYQDERDNEDEEVGEVAVQGARQRREMGELQDAFSGKYLLWTSVVCPVPVHLSMPVLSLLSPLLCFVLLFLFCLLSPMCSFCVLR